MDETIYVILKVLFDFALEVWFSIVSKNVLFDRILSTHCGVIMSCLELSKCPSYIYCKHNFFFTISASACDDECRTPKCENVIRPGKFENFYC